jgi:hypothetical protein
MLPPLGNNICDATLPFWVTKIMTQFTDELISTGKALVQSLVEASK